MLSAISTVPGRVRFKVPGLYRCRDMKDFLEKHLLKSDTITAFKANELTGSLLVRFRPEISNDHIAQEITNLIQRFSKENHNNRKDGQPSSLVTRKGLKQKDISKHRLRQLLHDAKQQLSMPWHKLSASEVLKLLKTDPIKGLSSSEAERRLKHYGPNILPEEAARSSYQIFLDQFLTIPVGLLTAAAGLSLLTGGLVDAIAIMTVVGINAILGFVTESQSEKTIHSLKNLVRPMALVVREGETKEIGAEYLVPGDIIILRPGYYVPADGRIIQAERLTIDESALTGESVPILKTQKSIKDDNIPINDMTNMCFMGTLVTGSQGVAVVVATGRFTEMGQIHALIVNAKNNTKTPMERELDTLGTKLVLASSFLCAGVFVLGILRGNGFIYMLKTSVSLAVAAVPEGLPTVATTTLALGIKKMRENHILIRTMNAVESLGAVQVFCMDKTGTITENRMIVVELYIGNKSISVKKEETKITISQGKTLEDPFFSEEAATLTICTLCNESELIEENGYEARLHGTPTENALLDLAMKVGIDIKKVRQKFPLLKMLYRSEDRNWMASFHQMDNEQILIAVKGSPSEVVQLSARQMIEGKLVELNDNDREQLLIQNERMAKYGLRNLATAYKIVSGPFNQNESDSYIKDLIFTGIVGMADPVRDDVPRFIEKLHRAGIRTVMITGDQAPTAYAIGRSINISGNEPIQILDSVSFYKLDKEARVNICSRVHVFARVSPANKLEIVEAIKEAGFVVAMTGDGVNDSPALKAADLGIAMGATGTDVARDVADVIVEDDNIETLVMAVAQGRTINTNVKKSLHFLLATNMSEIMVSFIGNVAGWGQPLTEMQLLWINLVTDIFPGLALSVEPEHENIMKRPPRNPYEPLVRETELKIWAREAGVMTATSLGAYYYGLARYGIGPRASTLSFLSLTASQLLHCLSCRADDRTIFSHESLPTNPHLNLALWGTFALQGIVMFIPGLRTLLGISRLGILDIVVVGAASTVPILINEALKPKGDKR